MYEMDIKWVFEQIFYNINCKSKNLLMQIIVVYSKTLRCFQFFIYFFTLLPYLLSYGL